MIAGAAVVGSAFALSTPTASAARWEVRQIPPPVETAGEKTFFGISCPSASLCVAAGVPNMIVSSTNPGGGPSAWKVAQPVESVPCEDNPQRCLPPPPGFPPSPPPHAYRKATDVSCPTAGFCAAVTFDGFLYTTFSPTGGAGDWKVVDLDGDGRDTHLESISCPDPDFCVAVSGDRYTAGKILSSANPAGGATEWSEVDLGEAFDLRGVSCPSRTLCLAVANNGHIVRSTNPRGPATDWKDLGTPGGPGNLDGVSCVLSALCLTGNSGGNLLSTTNPFASVPDWHEANGGGSVQITDVSCPSSSRCIAVDNNGNVLTSRDPTGGAQAWTLTNLISYTPPPDAMAPQVPNAIFGATCPSASFCALAASDSRIFTSFDPFAVAQNDGDVTDRRTRRSKRPRTILARVDRWHPVVSGRRFKARFRFFATGPVRKFICKHDRRKWRACRSPHRYWVGLGKHVFRVRAIGRTGLKGPIALDRFRAIRNPNL